MNELPDRIKAHMQRLERPEYLKAAEEQRRENEVREERAAEADKCPQDHSRENRRE